MSDEKLRRSFEQFRDGPAGPTRMPAPHEIRRRARVWRVTRLGGVLAVVAVVVWAGTLVAGQVSAGPPPNGVAGPPPPTEVPVPVPTGPPSTASRPPTMPTLPHARVTSPASDTFRIQPSSVRAGQTVTLSGQGCTKAGVRASQLLITIDVESPDLNDRVAWLQYPVDADGSWQGQWRIPKLPSGIKYGPGFQLQPSCNVASYRGGSKSIQGFQYIFSYDLQRLTIQPPV